MSQPLAADLGVARRGFLTTPQGAAATVFFVFGLALGLWSGASASILQHVGISAPTFGLAMTLFAVAYLAAMSSGGVVGRFFSVRKILLGVAPLQGVTAALLLLAPSTACVFAALALFGFFCGLLDVAMNAEGTRVEHDLGRTVLAGLHGGASASIAIGALAGSLIAAGPGEWASALIAVAAAAVSTFIVAIATPERGLDHISAAPGESTLFTRTLIVIGLVLGVSIAGETAATVWSATLLQQEAPRLSAIVGLGAAFFAGCQAFVRFFADRPRRIFGDRRMIIGSLAVAALGFLIVAGNLGFVASVVGFAIIGIGTGAAVPCGFALAVSRSRFSHSAALSTVALFTAIPRIPAPLAMGAIANWFSLASAFGLFAVLLAFAFAAMLAFIKP
jgi:MFS family permease